MKTAYSTYSAIEWREFKRWSTNHSESAFCRFCTAGQIYGEVKWAMLKMHALFLWKYKRIRHYFLAPGVAQFCRDAVKDYTPDYCKRLPNCAPVSQPTVGKTVVFWPFAGGVSDTEGGFAIHLPSQESQRSLICIPDYHNPIPRTHLPQGMDFGGEHYYCAITDGNDSVMMQPHPGLFSDDGADNMAKLVLGLSLYMDAFPDAVVEAVAENVHKIKHYGGARRIVNRNEIVDEEHRHSVSPHWRRGHFRLLTSAKFVRKQGQTVYVRGTFVTGKAFDVMEDAPPCTANAESEVSE